MKKAVNLGILTICMLAFMTLDAYAFRLGLFDSLLGPPNHFKKQFSGGDNVNKERIIEAAKNAPDLYGFVDAVYETKEFKKSELIYSLPSEERQEKAQIYNPPFTLDVQAFNYYCEGREGTLWKWKDSGSIKGSDFLVCELNNNVEGIQNAGLDHMEDDALHPDGSYVNNIYKLEYLKEAAFVDYLKLRRAYSWADAGREIVVKPGSLGWRISLKITNSTNLPIERNFQDIRFIYNDAEYATKGKGQWISIMSGFVDRIDSTKVKLNPGQVFTGTYQIEVPGDPSRTPANTVEIVIGSYRSGNLQMISDYEAERVVANKKVVR